MEKIFESETHLKLSVTDVNESVITMVKQLNLYGGSNGEINLYNLLQTYLLKPESRPKINEIVKQFQVF